MRFPGFIGPSYTLTSKNYECQRCINLYPEVDEIGTGKEGEVASLIGTPGLSLLTTLGTGPVRGLWLTTTGLLFAVSGVTIYSITSSWVATAIGTLKTSTGQVGMADNGLQLVIVDGPNGYYITLPTSILTQITDINWLGSNVVTFQDGYFIFARPNSKEFYLSDLNAITFTAPALTSKEGYPDNLITLISSNRNVWLFGDQTTEVWFDSGDNLNPFQYIQGTFIEYGCAAMFSVTRMANTVFWLAKDQTGKGIVVQANGYAPKRISTHAVELAIQGYSTMSDAIAFSYQENGHQFYMLTFPTGNATWVFDIATSMWHERASLSQGIFQRHLSNCFSNAFGANLVGDYSSGNLYKMSSTVYSDNGNPLVRQRITPHISKDMNRIGHNTFQLDLEPGTGIDGTGQGIDPQAMLQWSNDGGHTWSNEHVSSFGKIGATKGRAIWRRLGMSRNRVYKVSISDPVKVVMIGAELDVMEGAS